MNRAGRSINGQKGVTLLEIIVSLVVAAIFAVMIMQYMGSTMLRSADPLIMAQDSASLTGVMETVTADYKRMHAIDNVNILTNLETEINNETYDTNECTVSSEYIKFIYNEETENYDEVPDTVDKQILKVTATKVSASGVPLHIVSLFTRMY